MTDHEDPTRADDLLGVEGRVQSALVSMEAFRVALERKARELGEAEMSDIDISKLSTLQRDMARALLVATEAEGKAHDVRSKSAGGGGLDLVAAAAEVRRRLAILRGYANAGQVS